MLTFLPVSLLIGSATGCTMSIRLEQLMDEVRLFFYVTL